MQNFPNIQAKKVVWSFLVGSLIFVLLIVFLSETLVIHDGIYPWSYVKKVDQCVPNQHVMFLKTHKCGSSTIQNILLRFGYTRNLSFALPKSANYIGRPKRFKASSLPSSLLPSSGLVDIFCLHSRLDANEMKKVLHNDTVWVTTVRNPVSLFESLYSFYNLHTLYNRSLYSFENVSLEELATISRTKGGIFGKNQMLFDLGADENLSVMELSQKLVEGIDNVFDVVIIMEKMEESLILLRHKLCWSLDDIVFFSKNARQKKYKKPISQKLSNKIKQLNSADVLLYNHFLLKHQREVLRFGEERMKQEVLALKNLINDYYEGCVMKEVEGRSNTLAFKEYSGQVTSYLLKNGTGQVCEYLTFPELHFIDTIRERQKVNLVNKQKL